MYSRNVPVIFLRFQLNLEFSRQLHNSTDPSTRSRVLRADRAGKNLAKASEMVNGFTYYKAGLLTQQLPEEAKKKHETLSRSRCRCL